MKFLLIALCSVSVVAFVSGQRGPPQQQGPPGQRGQVCGYHV